MVAKQIEETVALGDKNIQQLAIVLATAVAQPVGKRRPNILMTTPREA